MTTEIIDTIVAITKTQWRLLESVFPILPGSTKNAQSNNTQNILSETAIKIDRYKRYPISYIPVFIHWDFAISDESAILRSFFQKTHQSIIPTRSIHSSAYISIFSTNKILPKRKLNISIWIFQSIHIPKIHPANQICEIISLLDSREVGVYLSIPPTTIAQSIAKIIPKR